MYSDDSKEETTGLGTFDFNKIIPMPKELDIECGTSTDNAISVYLTAVNPKTPDYCFEKLSKEEFANLVRDLNGERVYSTYNTAIDKKDLQKYLGTDSFDKVSHFGEKIVEAFKKYGSTNWYHWCVKNWGTKWNSYDGGKEGDNLIYFNTAWSPPTPVIEALARKYKDVHIIHEWADEDIGNNCGSKEYVDGELFAVNDYTNMSHKELVDFALGVWGDTPESYGFVLNKSGTGYINMDCEDYEVVEVLGQRALFTNDRLSDDDIPEGMYVYHLRHDDEGNFVTIEPKVIVNHAGSILTAKPIDFGDKDYIAFDEDSSPNFKGTSETFYEFLGG
jgi:hypothetical protein